jgi:hypothetical protein
MENLGVFPNRWLSLKNLPKPGEGAVKKNQLKKSPLRRLARSS